MSSRYGVLSVLLLFVVLLLAYKNYETWSQPFERETTKEAARKPEGKSESSLAIDGRKRVSPDDSILVISQKNIFNPDRKEFPLLTMEQTKPTARPQIILYGVMIADDYQTASIITPGRTLHKGEREIKTLKLGDQIGDYKITKILPDRITVEAPGDSFEVLLYDARLPKKRPDIKTTSRPAEVTSALPGPSPVPAAPASPGPTPSRAMPTPPASTRDRVIEGQVPRPATPVPTPGADIYRGRRPLRPSAPEGTGTN
jgi:hypothetical protein